MLNKTPRDNHEKTVSAHKILPVSISLMVILLVLFIVYSYGRIEAPSHDAVVCNPGSSLSTKVISAGGHSVRVEVASTVDEKVQGLSGRNCLDANTGMFFTYDNPGSYCYWMKDMKFSIDMIWLDRDYKVVTIKEGVSPSTYPSSFCPDSSSQYILEVPDGFSKKSGWQTGTQFSLQ